jgi:hypothetical protein
VRHVAVFGDDLEALDGLRVADDIVEVDWAVLFDPALSVVWSPRCAKSLFTRAVRSLLLPLHWGFA